MATSTWQLDSPWYRYLRSIQYPVSCAYTAARACGSAFSHKPPGRLPAVWGRMVIGWESSEGWRRPVSGAARRAIAARASGG